MAHFDYREIYRIIREYYKPGNPSSRLTWKDPETLVRLDFGIVVDCQDPDKKSRIKVQFPHWINNCITGWIPMVRPYVFETKSFRCEPQESDSVEMSQDLRLYLKYDDETAFDKEIKIISTDGSENNYIPDENGTVEAKNLIPGKVEIVYEEKNDDK